MLIVAFGLLAISNLSATKAGAQTDPAWTTPYPPFRIADGLYYVGSKDLASYLIVTPRGDILINGNLASSPPLINASVEKLGFKFGDIKILLISHAHSDHCGGCAEIKRLTGAKYMVMDRDAQEVERGGRGNFAYGNSKSMSYAPAKVDRILHDGDQVSLGGTTLTAHLTAGHTKGCTTWTMKASDHGRFYNVVIVGSPNVNPGYKMVHNKLYPEIASDYRRGFRTLKSLPCDIFLGAHGGYFDMLEKLSHKPSSTGNPLVDPAGYRDYVSERESAFERELAKQQKAN